MHRPGAFITINTVYLIVSLMIDVCFAYRKNPQAMTSYKLFSHSEPLGAILGEIYGLFNRITPFDIKQLSMAAILFFKMWPKFYTDRFS